MATQTPVLSDAQKAQQARQINDAISQVVKRGSVRMEQQIFNQTIADPANNPVVTIPLRNVGLVLGCYLSVSATITETGGASDFTLTDFGPANLIQRISFVDLENNERINTTGYHLALLNSLKARRPYGDALVRSTGIGSILGYGSNYTVDAGANITKSKSGTYTKWFWVPFSYSENDLRGAVYANVVNATAQLQLTLAQVATNLGGAPADDTAYIATGGTGTITNVVITCTQVYLDQLPRDNNGMVLLPQLDLATVYEMKSTVYTGLTVGTDFPIDYPNFRDFLSTVTCYYDGANRLTTNVNYHLLQSANFTTIWKRNAALSALRTRNHLGCDLPKGFYYFGSREKPIATNQYGNMQLVVNPSIAGATAKVTVMFENFAFKNLVRNASSLNT